MKLDVKERMKQLHFAEQRKKIIPPYDCPFCCKPECVHVEKKGPMLFYIYCQNGCFNGTADMASPNLKEIDAFNLAVDMVRQR